MNISPKSLGLVQFAITSQFCRIPIYFFFSLDSKI
jgi:hypothetical protein